MTAMGARTRVATACLYTTKTVGLMPRPNAAFTHSVMPAKMHCVATIAAHGLYPSATARMPPAAMVVLGTAGKRVLRG
uniref:Uncharacterized protein n=1 Tax=Arundo donax TaxID=35708 RepID=A0A0A9EG28_ARUDO